MGVRSSLALSAERAGLSRSAAGCIRQSAFAPQPHRAEPPKLSADPPFVDEVLRDVAGRGLDKNPPDRAPVPCADEQPTIQAKAPTAPVLPRRGGALALG